MSCTGKTTTTKTTETHTHKKITKNSQKNPTKHQTSATQGRRTRTNLSFDLPKTNCMKEEKTKSMKGGNVTIFTEVSSKNYACKLKKERKCQSPGFIHLHQSVHIP